MRRGTALLLAVLLGMLSVCTACKPKSEGPDLSGLGPSSAATTTILPSGGPNCPGGGIGIYTGKDGNANGMLEAAEVLDGSPVCNQLAEDGTKTLGHGTLVMVSSEPSGTQHCPAGGLKVLSGPDANRNGLLETDEVLFTNYVCNGAPGTSSAAGITVALGQVGVPSDEGKKKGRKPEPAKKQQAKQTRAAARSAAAADPAAAEPKQGAAAPAAPNKGRSGAPKPAPVPQGWHSVKVSDPQLASVAYKMDGTYIVLRFKNLSSTSTVRYKYTVRWMANRNGSWVSDSSVEGLSFRLKPLDSLDREVRTQAKDVRDVVVDLEVSETT